MSLTFSIILSSGSSTNRWASYVNKIEPRASMTTMNSVLAMLIIDSACKAALVLYATMNSRPFSAVKAADREARSSPFSSTVKFYNLYTFLKYVSFSADSRSLT